MKTLEELITEHAANVTASSIAWTEMSEAQSRARLARDKEHASAEAIEDFIKNLIQCGLNINESFKPVPLDINLDQ